LAAGAAVAGAGAVAPPGVEGWTVAGAGVAAVVVAPPVGAGAAA
jgi:hypothetical protein